MVAMSSSGKRTTSKSSSLKVVGPTTAPPLDPWEERLRRDSHGHFVACSSSVATILQNHVEWEYVLAYDSFRQTVVSRVPPPWYEDDAPPVATEKMQPWHDEDYHRCKNWFERSKYGFVVSVETIAANVKLIADKNQIHPVQDYVMGTSWDHKSRVETWLIDYLGAADTPYTRMVGKRWLISAIARIFVRPECKVDYVLILEGKQGLKKSTALKVLGGADWFTDTPIEIGNKDAYIAIQGRWIVELAELATLSKSDTDRAKAFFSSSVDVYRQPFGKTARAYPRQCVFAGTVNPSDANNGAYLKDDTGGRRYWPVRCESIDIDALTRDRDQLWAEALHLWGNGQRWWPDEGEEALCATEQDARFVEDAWEQRIDHFVGLWEAGKHDLQLGTHPTQRQTQYVTATQQGADWFAERYLHDGDWVTTQELIFDHLLGAPKWQNDQRAQRRLAGVLARLGMVKSRPEINGVRVNCYMRRKQTPIDVATAD